MALLLAGCGPAPANYGDDAGGPPSLCVIDPSRGPGSALPLGTQEVTGQICPRGDEDWYSLTVPAGDDLLDLRVGYPHTPTRVAILAQLFLPDGKTPVPNGELVDTSTGIHEGVLSTTIKVPMSGAYLLEVRDASNTMSDELNTYVLQATAAADPDTHEPNDTVADAKATDGMPGWIAYQGDQDYFHVNVPSGSSLLELQLENPMTAHAVLHYKVVDAGGTVIGESDAAPSMTMVDVLRPVPAAGDYYVDVTAAPGSAPDRTAGSAYVLALDTKPELDPHDQGVRNDHGLTAVCLGGASGGGCAMAFSGGAVTFPTEMGEIDSLGDRDYYRLDVASGAPAVLELDAVMPATPQMQLAVDLLVPDANSPCTQDSQCAALNIPCGADSDCELSHSCLPAAQYTFCPMGQPCRLCAGASACVPLGDAGGPEVCAAPQYLVHDTSGGGGGSLHTAQPLFAPGPYYVVVHDYQDDQYAYGVGYTLDARILPEPDPGDQSPDPSQRNNFYNPYPMQDDDLTPSAIRAKDITAAVTSGAPVVGWISYQSDEDWFSFLHPCPGMNCGLVFEWTQPGPSNVRVAFLMRRGDDLGIHESWTYVGNTATSMLTGPLDLTWGNADCTQCSFASAMQGNGDPTYRYFLQVRDVGSKDWDPTSGGRYQFRVQSITPGCPASCSEGPNGCGCFCKAQNMCPPGPAL